ncbi:MAG: cysteinyl-tRNA synthetase [Candidatus Peregrinibacteria bacterium Greene0416_62]|nr:MAG: cysteinyl-tRNA synthetase [Candidatus Peregrinibacteria bacterium Greene0416_62]TSC98694.1 MAG: cysteinyl-tRNA synthetase [Candidatus Peregrinibacteria bacterium Greene1014_49]
MPLRLYNTLTKQEEDFIPLDPAGKVVTMYTCGPTVYGRPHIGNYASFLMADLLKRWLQAGHGYTVRHVKNITDVGHLLNDADKGEDKIEKEAEKEKGLKGTQGKSVASLVTREDVLAVVERYTQQYIEDEKALNFLEPEARPRASHYIKEQLNLTKRLLKSGHAYELQDAIYFSVESKTLTPYGTLSGNTLDQISSGARVDIHEGKKHPADFALWKRCIGQNSKHILRWLEATGEVSHTDGEDKHSGFPGWHIECSAMSSSILGHQIDIHTGGEDNIFPHHECEIAQSESALGVKPFVAMWVHRRRIQMGEEKMSKSLGNVLSLQDIIAQGYSPLDLRYYLLSVHYRTNLKFTEKGIGEARGARRKIAEWMGEVENSRDLEDSKDAKEYVRTFSAAMDSDMNVSAALAVVFEIMAYSRNKNALGACKAFVKIVKETFACFDAEVSAVDPQALALASARDAARAKKDFKESDRIRDQLVAMGYEVRDSGNSTQIRKK